MARVILDEYSNKVINVVKAKYGLKDKSEALNKFIHMYGADEADLDAKDEYVEKMEKIVENHLKKYGYRHTTVEELRKEIESK